MLDLIVSVPDHCLSFYFTNVTGYRYITPLYCFAVQAGFYNDAVECLTFVRRVAGSTLGRVRSEDIFLRLLHKEHFGCQFNM